MRPRAPPSSSDARLASTSFMFMFVCVPEPVCHTESGNSPACAPASTSSAACAIAWASGVSSKPSSPLTRAATRLTRASAISSGSGMRSVEMRKCMQRALRLRTPQRVGGHLDVAEGVVFDSSGGHGISL